MSRLKNLFKKDENKLIVFITAGFPKKESTEDLVLQAIEGGADMIEIGIPFSDPQADGPIIQRASEIALSNGISLSIIFDQVRSIRKKTDKPIVLMGYYNPILAYGIDKFLIDCKTSQVDGIILPDLPLDEGTFFCEKAKSFNIQNPRPYFLEGQSKFYTPSAFGGGVEKAFPILENALEYYSVFQAKKYWPNWGYEDCKKLYEESLKQIDENK